MLSEQAIRLVTEFATKGEENLERAKGKVADLEGHIGSLQDLFGAGMSPMEKFTSGLEMMGTAVLDNGVASMAAFAGSVLIVGAAVGKSIQLFAAHYSKMIEFQKAVGMNTEEMHVFSSTVIEAAQRYGVAIDKVGDIAMRVSIGTKGTTSDVGKLAGSLGLLSTVTGASAASLGDLHRFFTRTMHWSEDAATHFLKAVKVSTDELRVPFSDVIDTIGEMGLEFSKMTPGITRDMVALITSLKAANLQNPAQVLRQMLDPKSALGMMYSAAANNSQFLETLSGATRIPTIEAIQDKSSRFGAMRGLEDQFPGVPYQALKALNDIRENKTFDKISSALEGALGMSASALDSREQSLLNPFTKLGMAVDKLSASFVSMGQTVTEVLLPAIEWFADVTKDVADLLDLGFRGGVVGAALLEGADTLANPESSEALKKDEEARKNNKDKYEKANPGKTFLEGSDLWGGVNRGPVPVASAGTDIGVMILNELRSIYKANKDQLAVMLRPDLGGSASRSEVASNYGALDLLVGKA
jgi:hypothetical protein